MQIIIVHGYFLNGTGSNIFVKNACRELCRMGHNVLLFCQENDVLDIDFIENVFDFDNENSLLIAVHKKDTLYSGKCTLYRPNLNGFLPVYVYDQYSGYKVKEFTCCTKEEIENYIDYNMNAINCAVKGKIVDLVWTNHSIMQPVYVARSILGNGQCLRVITVHGSCLNFSVRKSELLKEYALEAIYNNHKIAFLSRFSMDEFLEFFNDNQLIKNRSIVISAGVDLEKFMPINNTDEKSHRIQDFLIDLTINMKKVLVESDLSQKGNGLKTDVDVINKISNLDYEKDKIILYYGKYLWTKGIQQLIAAAPMIMQKYPSVRFVLVGYGSSRDYFEALINALNNHQKEVYINLLQHPDEFDFQIDKESSKFFYSLLKQLEDTDFSNAYFSTAEKVIKSSMIFIGFLKHDHLKTLIACSDITVAPSIFPEAFGLVAVESLASGVIPVQTNHSGYAEVIEKYVKEFADIFDAKKLNPLCLDENLTLNIASNIISLLDYYKNMEEIDKQSIRQRARKVSLENYSWEVMVHKYLFLVYNIL